MDIRKLIQNAQMKEIFQNNLIQSQSDYEPSEESSLPFAMNTAFKDVLNQTKLPLSNNFSIPDEVKTIIAQLIDSENGPSLPTDFTNNQGNLLIDAFKKLTDVISKTRLHPIDQFSASATFKTLAMGLISLATRYQSEYAMATLKQVAKDIPAFSIDGKWLKNELKKRGLTKPEKPFMT